MPQDIKQQNNKSEEMSEALSVFAQIAATPNPILLKTSGQAASRIVCNGLASLNLSELQSINALLAYVAYNQHVEKETVQAVVEAQFGVDQVEKLPQRDYEEVVRFLVDLCVEDILN